MSELWRPIKGFARERQYEVSNCGRVRGFTFYGKRSTEKKMFKQTFSHGYRIVTLVQEDGYRPPIGIHVLVATAFCGRKPTKKHEVNHEDSNKQNNCDWNLTWTTRGENIEHFLTNVYEIGRAHV